MKLIEVKTKKASKRIISFTSKLYSNEESWIRPLDKDIEEVFDENINKNFMHGKFIRWILEDNNEIIGTVAAFVNNQTANKDNDQPTGGIGFFECINSQEAANLLFDACKKLAKGKRDGSNGWSHKFW